MKILNVFFIVFLSMQLISCNDNSSSEVTAPQSLAGKLYKVTIISGTSFFATKGTYTVNFSENQNIYTITGDGVNVGDSTGLYTYFADGSDGKATISDSSFGDGEFLLVFTSTTSGTFIATALADASAKQVGVFLE